ncbi:MAG: hypothetical protein EOO23_08980 [Comamonadaceae bacterium]|nr:MAG: hypothetical protein EOO23_08980 [Comamonadaceae bacterium]
MALKNDADLHAAVHKAGELLQEIQDYLAAQDFRHRERPDAKVRFPRGFIRPASEQRARLTFLKNRALKDNLAYTLILSDTVLWLQMRTDLWGTPKEMLTKTYVFLVGTLVESITKSYLEGICGKNFKKRCEYLVQHKIISEDLQADLDWLWDTRNRMHLFQLEEREFENDYNTKSHARCVRAFRGLLAALSAKGPLDAG